MHILIIPSWYRASAEDTQGSFFREQALALAKHGCQVGVIYPQHRSMRQWQSVFSGLYGFAEENDRGMPTLRMHGMTWFPKQIPYANYLIWIHSGFKLYRRYVEKYGRPDVIHAHGLLYGGLLAWRIKALERTPFVVTEHCTAYMRGLFAWWELRLAAQAAQAADRRFAVSDAFAQQMVGFLGEAAGRWETFPNVVNRRFTSYPLSPTNALSKTASSPFTFINVAYLTNQRKGIHTLITAFAETFKGDLTTRLKIGGDGKERPRLESLAQTLGIAEQVTFLGALDRDQVRVNMAESDVFVLASRYETFGVVIIEALALGKPVIATRCGGPDRVVREQDGLLVPPDDVTAMAGALRQMRDRHHSYDAVKIRQSCIERYGEAAIAQRLRAVYADVMGHEYRQQKAAAISL